MDLYQRLSRSGFGLVYIFDAQNFWTTDLVKTGGFHMLSLDVRFSIFPTIYQPVRTRGTMGSNPAESQGGLIELLPRNHSELVPKFNGSLRQLAESAMFKNFRVSSRRRPRA